LPDIVAVANENAENFWSQYPDCFVNLKTLGYTEEEQAGFPDFKRTELENGDIAYAMPWDSGPVAMFYRRDLYEAAGVDPVSITTWDDFIAAGKQISAANPGVVMGQADFNGDSEWFRMLSNEQGCGYFAPDGTSITINQPGCVLALTKIKEMKDAGTLSSANWDGKIQANQAGTVASQLFGAWYEGTIRTSDPEGLGKWGVYLMPSLTEDGPRAANLGGSALALTSASDVPEEAYAFLHYTLATNEGQVTMLKEFGLVPSLLSALEDPFVSEGLDYWGGQKIWQEILATLPKIRPDRGTPFKGDAESILRATQTRFLNGEYTDAKAALDDAANQISNATGLPVAQ
ncbi:MAG TPA: ABC transporter substrate-binding protein, partial [Ramlibacter sp.]